MSLSSYNELLLSQQKEINELTYRLNNINIDNLLILPIVNTLPQIAPLK